MATELRKSGSESSAYHHESAALWDVYHRRRTLMSAVVFLFYALTAVAVVGTLRFNNDTMQLDESCWVGQLGR